jgi:hypothetical protein
MFDHLLHHEWVANPETQTAWRSLSAFLTRDLADIEAGELHETRHSMTS